MNNLLLKRKIGILLTTVSIVSLILVSVIVYFYINSTLIENKKREIYTTAVEQSHESVLVFKNSQIVTHMLATRTRVKDFLLDSTEERRSELLSIFSAYSNENPNYLAIYLLDKNGIGLVSTDPRFVGEDYSFRNYFKKAINGENYLDVALGKTSNELGYYFSEPVRNNDGSILGILVLKVHQDDIDGPIIKSSLINNSIVMLVDEFGVIVSTNQEDRMLKSLGVLSEQEKIKIKENEKFLDIEILPLQYDMVHRAMFDYQKPTIFNINDKEDGDQELLSLIKLENLPFYLVVETRLDSLERQVLNTVFTIVSIILIDLIFVALFIFYFIRSFIKPLDKFKLFFSYISNGDFSKRLEINTKDEFADMALVVNAMTDKLGKSYSILESKIKERTLDIEKEKGSLEIKIKERTKELEDLKNNLEKTVEERTEKLKDKLAELEQISKMMVDRELTMIKLKDEIKDLKDKLATNN